MSGDWIWQLRIPPTNPSLVILVFMFPHEISIFLCVLSINPQFKQRLFFSSACSANTPRYSRWSSEFSPLHPLHVSIEVQGRHLQHYLQKEIRALKFQTFLSHFGQISEKISDNGMKQS